MIKKLYSIFVIPILFSIFSITNCYAKVSVGDSYGGGTVFCVSQTEDLRQCVPEGSGDYGLIMANEDQVNFYSNPKHGVSWASRYTLLDALSDDVGAVNTKAIIAALKEDNPENNAAWLCHNYRDQEGHKDWYLPSKNELNNMYIYAKTHGLIGKDCAGKKAGGVQCLVGGDGEEYRIYWSSTEYRGDDWDAWCQTFMDGRQTNKYKVSNYFGVRAIRAFNNLQKMKIPQGIGLKVMAGDSLHHAEASAAAVPIQHGATGIAAPAAASSAFCHMQ